MENENLSDEKSSNSNSSPSPKSKLHRIEANVALDNKTYYFNGTEAVDVDLYNGELDYFDDDKEDVATYHFRGLAKLKRAHKAKTKEVLFNLHENKTLFLSFNSGNKYSIDELQLIVQAFEKWMKRTFVNNLKYAVIVYEPNNDGSWHFHCLPCFNDVPENFDTCFAKWANNYNSQKGIIEQTDVELLETKRDIRRVWEYLNPASEKKRERAVFYPANFHNIACFGNRTTPPSMKVTGATLQEFLNATDANVKGEKIMENEKVLSKENGVIRVFNSEEFGSLRIVEIDGEPWFAGKDVADVLGYKRITKAIPDHVDEDDRVMIDSKTQSCFGIELGQRGGWLINESGLYSLILSSKLPSAKKFKHWVTSEILPSIRKHGAYMTDETLKKAILDPDFLIKLATTLKEEQTKNKQLKEENEKLSETNKLLADDVLTWTNRNNVNAIVRKLSKVLSLQFGYMFNCIYKELFYKYGIALKNRASVAESKGGEKQSLLSYIREDEWSKVEAIISAICEKNGIDTESFFKEATNQAIKQTSPV